MARKVKMTFTLDEDTAKRIDRTALRLDIPKSAVVREAVAWKIERRPARVEDRPQQFRPFARYTSDAIARPSHSHAVTPR